MASVRFYTRAGCHLCDKALSDLEPLAKRHGVDIEIVDIDLDLSMLERYDHRVPVIEGLDGSVLDEGIVDLSVLANALERLG